MLRISGLLLGVLMLAGCAGVAFEDVVNAETCALAKQALIAIDDDDSTARNIALELVTKLCPVGTVVMGG